MNILVVSLTKFFGGGETFIVSHLSKIQNQNFYYCVSSEKLVDKLDKVKCFYVDGNRKENLAYIRKKIKEFNIDIIILNGGRSLFYANQLKKCCKVIGIRHTLNNYTKIYYRPLYLLLQNLSYLFMDKVVHVSKASQNEQFFARKKALTIYNGSEPKKITKGKYKKNNFVYIGRLTYDKGVNALINVFNKLKKNGYDYKLTLVGNGEIDESYPHEANVVFEGFQTELEKYYLNADYFISLTSQENCSLSVIDALSYGIPVVTTPVGGNPELVKDGYDGYIVKQNEEAVYNLIVGIISKNTAKDYAKLSKNCLSHYEENFNIVNQRDKYKELFESL